jgi:hypothetical protein
MIQVPHHRHERPAGTRTAADLWTGTPAVRARSARLLAGLTTLARLTTLAGLTSPARLTSSARLTSLADVMLAR